MTGKKVRELRKANNLTMRELAEKSGTASSYISDLENGKIKNPSGEKLRKIAEVFGVSTDYFLIEKYKEEMEEFSHNWNSKSEEEKRNIVNKTKEKWEEEEEETIINTIISIADKANTIDFFLNEDNTMNFESSKQMFDILVNTMKLIVNSSIKNK